MAKIEKRAAQLEELRTGAYDNLAMQLKKGSAPASGQSYERALAKLGNTILIEQVPELMSYMVGFQLLDKSDDGSFAAGFFIFDLGGTLVDCPIFLIDGKVKGYQIMYLREQGIFLPLLPEIVQHVLSQQDEALGEPSFGENEPRNNRATTNFDVYSSNNRFLQKVGSLESYPAHFTAWGRKCGALESFLTILKSEASEAIRKEAAISGMLPPVGLDSLLQSRKVASILWKWCQESPKLSQRVDSVLGDDWPTKMAGFFAAQDESRKKVAGFNLGNTDVLRLTKSAGPVRKIAMYRDLDQFKTDLDRQPFVDEILQYGACFFDERDTAKTAMLVQSMSENWMSPTESGGYEIPLLNGDRKQVTVVVPKDQIDISRKGGYALVVNKDDKTVAKVRVRDLATKPIEGTEALKDFDAINSAKSLGEGAPTFTKSNLKTDCPMILVDDAGKVTEPFYLREGDTDDVWMLESCYMSRQGDSDRNQPVGNDDSPVSKRSLTPGVMVFRDDCRKMWIEDIGGMDHEGVLVVPEGGTKVVYLDKEEDDDGYCYDCEPKSFSVMPISHLTDSVLGKKASFWIERPVADRVSINGQVMFDADAIFHMMQCGVSKTSALEVMDAAIDGRRHYLVTDADARDTDIVSGVKTALSPAEMNGDSDYRFREPAAPSRGQSDGHFVMPEEQAVRERITSDGMAFADKSAPPWSSQESPYSEASVMDGQAGGGTPGQGVADQQAVFENTLFESLVSNVNPGTERERLLSGLYKSSGDLGRSLFLVYAHGDEFADSYGLSDAEELEEELLTAHEATGKLMVKLFNRSVGPTTDLQLGSYVDS
jgi:hypothetical protein